MPRTLSAGITSMAAVQCVQDTFHLQGNIIRYLQSFPWGCLRPSTSKYYVGDVVDRKGPVIAMTVWPWQCMNRARSDRA